MNPFCLRGHLFFGLLFKRKFTLFTSGKSHAFPAFLVSFSRLFWIADSLLGNRSITLEHLRRMMAAFQEAHRDFYSIETGWKKLPQGGYRPEYKLSIAQHQRINRIRRFQYAIYVSPPALSPKRKRMLMGSLRIHVCQSTPSHPSRNIPPPSPIQKQKSSLNTPNRHRSCPCHPKSKNPSPSSSPPPPPPPPSSPRKTQLSSPANNRSSNVSATALKLPKTLPQTETKQKPGIAENGLFRDSLWSLGRCRGDPVSQYRSGRQ